jgi:hypothetical protein
MYRVIAKSDKATDFPALIYSFDFNTLAGAEEAVKFFTDEDTIVCMVVADDLESAMAAQREKVALIAEKSNESEDKPAAD